jgi:dimeric dUTPase (all-alpha-NTP-PPase superfamily)
MYRVMLKMKLFLKGRQRFLNFTKVAIKEALAKEWLPLLEDDDKVALLEEIAVIESISNEGVITKREPQCTSFANANISELHYGSSCYEAQQTRTSIPREPIKEVKPIANMAQILTPYIAWYKKWWKYMVKNESYKWNATEQFQKVFDINAKNLAENLKEALSLEDNLLSGHMNFSKDMLLKNAECSPQDIKSALNMLFDESLDLAKRVNDLADVKMHSHKITLKEELSAVKCKVKLRTSVLFYGYLT